METMQTIAYDFAEVYALALSSYIQRACATREAAEGVAAGGVVSLFELSKEALLFRPRCGYFRHWMLLAKCSVAYCRRQRLRGIDAKISLRALGPVGSKA